MRTFATLNEFYNPVLNTSWEAARDNGVSVKALFNQWKLFVTREVVKHIYEQNFAGSLQRKTWEWIAANTPDTDWWLVPFVSFSSDDGHWSASHPSYWNGV